MLKHFWIWFRIRVYIHMYTDAEKVQSHSWSWLRDVNDTAENNGTAESHTAVSMTQRSNTYMRISPRNCSHIRKYFSPWILNKGPRWVRIMNNGSPISRITVPLKETFWISGRFETEDASSRNYFDINGSTRFIGPVLWLVRWGSGGTGQGVSRGVGPMDGGGHHHTRVGGGSSD